MTEPFEFVSEEFELNELRRQDQVLAAMQVMLDCKRRGLCLLHEWFRRYGSAGSGCACFRRFQEHVMRDDVPTEDY